MQTGGTRDWVDRVIPAPGRPYVRLARLDRPIGIWLLVLPAWWALALGGQESPGPYALFAVGAVIMRAAGCVINDMWDRDLDAQVARTRNRPLASGAITLGQAFLFLAILLGMGLLVLMQFSRPVILLGFASSLLVVAYPLMKRVTWWPQAFLGFTFNWGVLMGAATLSGFPLPAWAWPLYAAGVLWTLGYDTIYAHQDKVDDAEAGVLSSARRLGRASRIAVALFYTGSLLLLALAGLAAHVGPLFYPLLLLPASHAVRHIRRWKIDDPADCLTRFRANRDFGLLVLGAIAAGRFLS